MFPILNRAYNRIMDDIEKVRERASADGNFIPPKIQVALLIGSLGWFVWATSSIYRLQPEQPRYTAVNAHADQLSLARQFDKSLHELAERMDARFDAISHVIPQNGRVEKLESKLDELRKNQATILYRLDQLMP